MIGFDTGNVDNGVNTHRVWKMEFDSVGPDQLHDGIRTKPSFQQLLRGAREMEVISGEPYLIPDGICRGV